MVSHRVWGRVSRAARRRPWAAAALAACLLAALAVAAQLAPAPAPLTRAAEYPRVHAHRLAHLLADLSAHTLTIPGSWTLDEEASNYSSWRYAVSYACGERCSGRTSVQAVELLHAPHEPHVVHEPHEQHVAPQHGRARAHRVLISRVHCHRLPLLPWPPLCEEIETDSLITSVDPGGSEAAGARLQQRVRARCSATAALLWRCSSAADVRATADALLLRVRDQLHNRDHRLAR